VLASCLNHVIERQETCEKQPHTITSMFKISFLAVVFLLAFAAQPEISAQANENESASRSGAPNDPTPASGAPVKSEAVGEPSSANNPASANHQPSSDTPKITDWLQAITSLALLAVIVVQACIYNKQRILMWKQWIAMRRGVIQTRGQLEKMKEALRIEQAKTDPRLRVEHVRALDFDPGKRPIYLVTIVNDGRIPARDVAFKVKVTIEDKDESSDDRFDVPAGETEIAFLASHTLLDEKQIDGFNSDVPLIITGSLSYFPHQKKEGDPPQGFCYKYLPWKGVRPPEIPQFVRCTRRIGSDITVRLGTGHFKLTGFAPTIILGKATPEDSSQVTPSGDVTNVVIHGNPPNEPQASVEKKEESEEKSGEAN